MTIRTLLIGVACGLALPAVGGSALRFDGIDDYVSLPPTQDLQLVQTDFTIEAWLFLDQLVSDSRIISGVTSPFGYQVHVLNNRIGADLTSSGGNINFTSNATLALAFWHHVAVVRQDDTVRLYIDGQFDSSATNNSMTYVGAVGEIRMGRREGGCCPHNGIIDEVRVWHYARSGAQIDADYRLPLAGDESGLAAYWRFDEGTGQVLVDFTGRGNDGRLGDSSNADAADPTWVASSASTCSDTDSDGYFYEGGCGTARDCNDSAAGTHPTTAELCDGYDNDCDQLIDNSGLCTTSCGDPGRSATPVQLSPTFPTSEDDLQQLVWASDRFVTVWRRGSSGEYQPVIQILNQAGTPISPTLNLDSTGLGRPEELDVVPTGRGFGATWMRKMFDPGMYFRRVTEDGELLGSPVLVSGSGGETVMRWSGTMFGIVREGGVFTRVDEDGLRIGPDVNLPDMNGPSLGLDLVWNGMNFVAVWANASSGTFDVYLAEISPNGNVSATRALVTGSARSEAPQIAWNGAGYGLFWLDDRTGEPQVFFRRLDASGNPDGAPTQITFADGAYPYIYSRPKVVWTGGEFGVTWVEDHAGSYSSLFVTVDIDGNNTSSPVLIATGPDASLSPLAAWTGIEYGVAFSDTGASGRREVFFAGIGCSCPDQDGDDVSSCSDCDDEDAATFPGAPQLCDGRNNVCTDPNWPAVPLDESDSDGDGYRLCHGDCDDSKAGVYPGALEVCNGVDDDCDGPVDEDLVGEDTDGDVIHNLCDNCRLAYNPDQLDADGDLVGSACDNCVTTANPGQQDLDSDQRGDVCDNCAAAYNPFQDDFDIDRRGDACDNCVFDFNLPQSDFDHDGQGDRCDLNDGLIYVFSTDRDYIEWQSETGPSSWGVYEGDLSVLKSTGVYSQAPGSNALAHRTCGVSQDYVEDFEAPPTGSVKFSLVTGVTGGVEGSLGTNSAGATRPNVNPCP